MRESSAQPRYWVLPDLFVRFWKRWMAVPDNPLPETARLCTADGHADDLLRRRMIVLGLDPDKLALSDPTLLLHLRKCCALCRSPEDCALDLARASTGQSWPDRDNWRDYCENVLTLEMLTALRSRSTCP
jgi:hypothetical protein